MIEVSNHDIVIVGAGAAGLRAAIAATETDPEISVGLVSKVYPMRSHTVSAEGGAAAVARDDDSLEMHGFDTVKGSDFLGDQDVIQYFVEEAPKELTLLEHWGCPWSRNEDGTVATRAFGGMSTKRTWYATDKVGFHMLHSLFQHSMRFDNIVRYDEYFATRLLVDDGAVRGVSVLDIRTGVMRVVLGRAVILATGGAGKIFPFTTNGNIKTGDGMALAYRAGVALKDMEFVQYHPTGLPGTGILITEATRGEGGYLKNSEGERFLTTRDYGVGKKAELGPRDMISRAIIQEVEAGRGISGPYGEYVHLDLTHLGEEKIVSRLPMVQELSKIYIGVDPVHDPIPVRPVVHYMMGGIDTDITAATSMPGLYAAGECASASLNGSNRLGSNSLTECLVFGASAGRNAVAYAKGASAGSEATLRRQGEEEAARIDVLRGKQKGGEKLARIRNDLHNTMETGCGVYRVQDTMDETVRTVAQLKGRYADVALDDSSKVFNTELIAALEMGNMLDIAEAVSVSAAARDESRGAHTRRDFPKRDDEKFLYHTLCYFDPAGPRLDKKDVTLGKWVPEGAEVLMSDGVQMKTFVVTRFDPDQDEVPRKQSYEIPVEPGWKVLDALNFIKDEVDATLSHRWSCRMAVCGSCGMMVDGEPKLTCKDSLDHYGDTIEIAPLSNFPVIRDLVIEADGFMEKFKKVKPWIIRAKELAVEEGPVKQSPSELAEFKQFSMCINCMLCYSACPVVANEPEFLGPAAIALGHRYSLDSRDEGAAQRNQIFRDEGTVFSCSFANECSEVCPKNVDPAAAVNQAKFNAVIDWATGLVLPRPGEE